MSGLGKNFFSLCSVRNIALTASAIALIITLSISFVPNASHAQESGDGTTPTYDVETQTTDGQTVNTNTGTGETTPVGEEPESNSTGEDDVIYAILALIAWGILKFLAFLMGIAGVLLNFAVNVFILEFGKYFAATAGVLLAWGIIRDVANIILVFGFVYIGISSILGLTTYTIEKTLPKLLIFAVLLNFSFFISATVIDATNAVSASLYSQAIPADSRCTNVANTDVTSVLQSGCADRVGISGSVLEASGLSGIFGFEQSTRTDIAKELKDLEELILYLLISIFLIISTFVFASTAIMLLTRAVVLLLVLILSPIGFIGMAIPFLKKQGEDWWKALIDNVLFAPIVLLLILASIKVAQGLSGEGGSLIDAVMAGISTPSGENEAGGGDITTSIGMVAVFLVVTGLMYAAIVVAKKFSSFGAEIAMNQAGKLAFGIPAMVARNTAGRGALIASRGLLRSPLGKSRVGRMVIDNTVGKLSKAGYDVRGIGAVKELTRQTGVDLGKRAAGTTDGIVGTRKAEQSKIEESIDTVRKADNARFDDLSSQRARVNERVVNIQERINKETNDNKKNSLRKDLASAKKEIAQIEGKMRATLAGKKSLQKDLAEQKQLLEDGVKTTEENIRLSDQAAEDLNAQLAERNDSLEELNDEFKKATTDAERNAIRSSIDKQKARIRELEAQRGQNLIDSRKLQLDLNNFRAAQVELEERSRSLRADVLATDIQKHDDEILGSLEGLPGIITPNSDAVARSIRARRNEDPNDAFKRTLVELLKGQGKSPDDAKKIGEGLTKISEKKK